MSTVIKRTIYNKGGVKRANIAPPPPPAAAAAPPPPIVRAAPVRKTVVRRVAASSGSMESELAKLRTAADAVKQIRFSAQRELEMARRMRADAQKYQVETATRARSEAQQLLLHARLTTQKEIEEIISKASAEIQKMLADMRVLRVTAQEELAAQKKFTDAARISSLSFNVQREPAAPPAAAEEPRKRPILIKQI
jgi:vacuolar-type H+-ATPase subunit H